MLQIRKTRHRRSPHLTPQKVRANKCTTLSTLGATSRAQIMQYVYRNDAFFGESKHLHCWKADNIMLFEHSPVLKIQNGRQRNFGK